LLFSFCCWCFSRHDIPMLSCAQNAIHCNKNKWFVSLEQIAIERTFCFRNGRHPTRKRGREGKEDTRFIWKHERFSRLFSFSFLSNKRKVRRKLKNRIFLFSTFSFRNKRERKQKEIRIVPHGVFLFSFLLSFGIFFFRFLSGDLSMTLWGRFVRRLPEKREDDRSFIPPVDFSDYFFFYRYVSRNCTKNKAFGSLAGFCFRKTKIRKKKDLFFFDPRL